MASSTAALVAPESACSRTRTSRTLANPRRFSRSSARVARICARRALSMTGTSLLSGATMLVVLFKFTTPLAGRCSAAAAARRSAVTIASKDPLPAVTLPLRLAPFPALPPSPDANEKETLAASPSISPSDSLPKPCMNSPTSMASTHQSARTIHEFKRRQRKNTEFAQSYGYWSRILMRHLFASCLFES